MKITVKKRQLILASIIFILVLVISALFVYEKYNLRTPTLDKYKELTESCIRNNSFGGTSYKCTAILERYEKKDGDDCFYFVLIKDSSTIDRFTICEKENSFDWDKEVYITEKQVPLYIVLEYKGISWFGYRLSDIKFTLLEDEEIYTLLETLGEKGISFDRVRTNSVAEVEELGYYMSNDLVLSSGKYIKRVFLYLGDIKSVKVDGSKLIFDSIFKIEKQDYFVQLSGSHIGYGYWLKGKTPDLNISNYMNYDLIGEAQAMFFYIDDKSNVTNSDLIEYCNKEDIDFDSIALCSIPDSGDIREFKINDIEEYMVTVRKEAKDFNLELSKLIFAYLEYK